MPQLTLVLGLLAALLPAAGAQQQLKTMTGTRGLVVHGKGGFLGTLPGSGPFTPVAGALGRSVAVADLNGDGFDELIAGAPLLPTAPQSQNLDQAGHVYIVFGSASKGTAGSAAKFSLDPIAAGTALNLVGDPGDHAGGSVAAAGDVNGDGFGDLIVGTPSRTVDGLVAVGGAYIVFGSADLAALSTDLLLSSLPGMGRALFVQGARALGAAGTSVSGGIDANADGLADVVIGAPLDSTDGHSQNGTATLLYGQAGFPFLQTFDLATLAPGEGTVVYGVGELQFLGYSVAGLGRFDAVLPMTNGETDPLLGDDVAIGAPGTQSGSKVLAGAAYVLRGVNAGSHDASYLASDFGNGPGTAGIVLVGAALGDQAGSAVARVGPLAVAAPGFTQLAISAPFNDGLGKADSGSAYLVYGGSGPQGSDLGLLPPAAGVTVWGATTAGGQRGVFVADAGDFDSDGQRDIAVAHPNAALIVGPSAYVGAGRVRILDGALLYAAAGPAYLGGFVPWTLMDFSGEGAGDFAGAALAAGDLNGDGELDLAVGAPAAASDPKPGDPTGVAALETGRAHAVYGAALRLTALQPPASWYGGPPVTITADGVPASVSVTVQGQAASVLAVVPGVTGSITFQVPPPPSPEALADVAVTSSLGSDTLADALQYLPLAVASGPTPAESFAGASAAFTGQGFSTVADTSVTVDGFPATVTAVDGLAGTMTVLLPDGPPDHVPLDVAIENSNGATLLAGSLVYTPILVSDVSPGAGPQTSGVFDEAAVPFTGQPPVEVAVTVLLEGGAPLPAGDLVIEFGTEELGYRQGVDPQIAGDVVTVSLPPFLLGPQNVTVDVRARLLSSGETGSLSQAFTYQASDYTELDEFSQPGLGPGAPAALMAGEFTNGGEVLLLMTGWQGPLAVGEVLLLGSELARPPVEVLGGLLGVQAQPEFIVMLPGGVAQLSISQAMPTDIPPSADGVSLYLQVITKESSGGGFVYGFSNVLQMTIDLP